MGIFLRYGNTGFFLKYGSVGFFLRYSIEKDRETMVRAMCGAKLMEEKRTEDLMEMLGLKETVVQMIKLNGVRWYGHVFRSDDGHVL